MNIFRKALKEALINSQDVVRYIKERPFDGGRSGYPLSCYTPPKLHSYREQGCVQVACSILNAVLEKYNLELIQRKNPFGFACSVNNGGLNFLLRYGMANDCYPILCFLERLGLHYQVSFDIGGNVAIVSTYLAKHSDTVHTFEPSKSTSELAERNLALNDIHNCIWNIVGVGAEAGELTYYEKGTKLSGHNSFIENPDEPGEAIKVPVIALDDYCMKNGIKHIDFMKIDVEGFEPHVIHGMRHILNEKLLDMLIFEVSAGLIENDADWQEMLKELEGYGFKFYNLYMEPYTTAEIKKIDSHQDVVAVLSEKADKFEQIYQTQTSHM